MLAIRQLAWSRLSSHLLSWLDAGALPSRGSLPESWHERCQACDYEDHGQPLCNPLSTSRLVAIRLIWSSDWDHILRSLSHTVSLPAPGCLLLGKKPIRSPIISATSPALFQQSMLNQDGKWCRPFTDSYFTCGPRFVLFVPQRTPQVPTPPDPGYHKAIH